MDSSKNVNITGTDNPIPVVNVVSPDDPPINVNVVGSEKPNIITRPDGTRSLEPTTTHQEDITTAGQRKINLIWEITQAIIAVSVVLSNVCMGVYFGVNGKADGSYPLVLSSSLFLIVGFYFSRTNHAAIGGVGKQPYEKYTGR